MLQHDFARPVFFIGVTALHGDQRAAPAHALGVEIRFLVGDAVIFKQPNETAHPGPHRAFTRLPSLRASGPAAIKRPDAVGINVTAIMPDEQSITALPRKASLHHFGITPATCFVRSRGLKLFPVSACVPCDKAHSIARESRGQ